MMMVAALNGSLFPHFPLWSHYSNPHPLTASFTAGGRVINQILAITASLTPHHTEYSIDQQPIFTDSKTTANNLLAF